MRERPTPTQRAQKDASTEPSEGSVGSGSLFAVPRSQVRSSRQVAVGGSGTLTGGQITGGLPRIGVEIEDGSAGGGDASRFCRSSKSNTPVGVPRGVGQWRRYRPRRTARSRGTSSSADRRVRMASNVASAISRQELTLPSTSLSLRSVSAHQRLPVDGATVGIPFESLSHSG